MRAFPSFNIFINRYKKTKISLFKLIILYIFFRMQFYFRRKRFKLFLRLITSIKKPIKILDIGGTINYWYIMNYVNKPKISITLLNLFKQKNNFKNIKIVVQDARDLSGFRKKQFDIVYSNSLIEHLGNYKAQQKLAKEICRIGKRYFIQTPNKYFPIEPHFLIPFFYLIPNFLKPVVVRLFSLKRWLLKINKTKDINMWINSIRLLDKKELKQLFKDGNIYEEKFLFFTKSFIVYK